MRKRQAVRILLGVIAIAALFWLLSSLVGKTVSLVTSPIYSVRDWFLESSATVPAYFKSRNELLDHVSELETKLATQSGDATTLTFLTAENDSLRGLLNINDANRIGARIVGLPPSVPYDQIYIDRGSHDGIEKGAYVYISEQHVIGFISKAFPGSSLVQLFSTPGVRSTVYVEGPDIYTYATGIGGGVIEIAVPQGIDISVGDVVVLPLTEQTLLGSVSSIESIPTEPEQRAYVTPDVSLFSLTHVAVSDKTLKTVDFETAKSYMEETIESLIVDVPAEILVEVGTSTATSTASSTGPARDL